MLSEIGIKADVASSVPSLGKESWRKHCQLWSKSGLSKIEYCRRNDLSKDNFYYWCKKTFSTKKSSASKEDLKSNFIPVVSTSTSEQTSAVNNLVFLELLYPNHLKVSVELRESTLVNLLKVSSPLALRHYQHGSLKKPG